MKSFFFIFSLLLGFTAVHCSQQQKTIARVGNTAISAYDLEMSMKLAQNNYDLSFLKADENLELFRKSILTRRIQEELLLAEVKRRGKEISEEELDQNLKKIGVDLAMTKKALEERKFSYENWRSQQRRRFLIEKITHGLSSEEVFALIDSLQAITPITVYEDKLQEMTLEENH